MDGVSSASAVVSLTVQLISTTRDVINFLRAIRDSPEELRSTIECLDQLRGNFEEVQSLVEEQTSCVYLPSSIENISHALRICESKIGLVELCVSKFNKIHKGSSSARKTWSSFKHVLNKGEIQRLRDQLESATKSLQSALTINSNRLAVRSIQGQAAALDLLTNIKSKPLVEDQKPGRLLHKSPQPYRVVSKETMLSWYVGRFGSISVQTKSKVIDGALNVHFSDRRSMSEENIYIFKPSFLKRQYELRTAKGYGHIFRALNVDCVVGFDAPVFDMCSTGDFRGLQDAICSGHISRHVVNPLGMGLLHYAAGSFQRDVCSWLLKIGVSADRTSDMGGKALTYMGWQSTIDQANPVTENMIEIARLLMQAQKDLSDYDISMWFREYDGPPEGAKLILSQDLTQYWICSADKTDPLHPALASILRLYAKDLKSWEPVVRTLIRYGADIHAPVRRSLRDPDQYEYPCPVAQYGTPLDELFMYTLDPLEGERAANGWLQILASEGHDILAYLETESALHLRPIQLTHPSLLTVLYDNERQLIFNFEERPTVAWDWWINPFSSTYLLRKEFTAMALCPRNSWLIMKPWRKAWPIRYPAWVGDDPLSSRNRKSQELAEARSARKLVEKVAKRARAQRRKGLRKVPVHDPNDQGSPIKETE